MACDASPGLSPRARRRPRAAGASVHPARIDRLRRPVPARAGAAYNAAMLQALYDLFAPAAMNRLTLVVNHVLAAEPVATERLRPHAGRHIALAPQGWPTLLPPLPTLAFVVTPAGLLEWAGQEVAAGAMPMAPTAAAAAAAADLTVRFDAANPVRLLATAISGETPAVEIDGDAQLATDVNWLMQNLRWDVEADLERVFGPAAAHQIHRLGSALARSVRKAMQGASAWRRPA